MPWPRRPAEATCSASSAARGHRRDREERPQRLSPPRRAARTAAADRRRLPRVQDRQQSHQRRRAHLHVGRPGGVRLQGPLRARLRRADREAHSGGQGHDDGTRRRPYRRRRRRRRDRLPKTEGRSGEVARERRVSAAADRPTGWSRISRSRKRGVADVVRAYLLAGAVVNEARSMVDGYRVEYRGHHVRRQAGSSRDRRSCCCDAGANPNQKEVDGRKATAPMLGVSGCPTS